MHVIRNTRSVCPICLKNISAQLVKEDNCVKMQKTCPEHGSFSAIVWRGKTDFESWRGNVPMLGESDGNYCPQNCGICAEHQQGSCCVLLEVTRRCNLKCKFCFADEAQPEPTMDELKRAVDKIFSRGKPLVQLSGGEPTLRDDLPELIAYIRSSGAQYVQLNSNGLRLAEDEGYVKALADAGLSFVFMQFDGISDDVYMALRGKELFETKRRAIEMCGKYGLGVTLVPTVVRGVNEHQLGDIIRFGTELSPVVRGVHFQPVSYFGRYPTQPDDDERYTLDELIEALGTQAGISEENIAPSRCDHPGCGLHASFAVMPDRSLMPLTVRRNTDSVSTAGQNREYIGSRWKRSIQAENSGTATDMSDFDSFISRVSSHSFTVTAMAFQDAMNLDIERLRRCSLHVYEDGKLKPFCAAYLSPIGGK